MNKCLEQSNAEEPFDSAPDILLGVVRPNAENQPETKPIPIPTFAQKAKQFIKNLQ